MGSRFVSCIFIFYVLLVSQCTHTNSIKEITERSWKDDNKEPSDHLQQTAIDDHLQSLPNNQKDYENIFFTVHDLKLGKTIPIYFPIKDPSTSPHLLPREEAESIPFSSSQLQQLLEFFSFSKHSPKAKAMEYRLSQCEFEPLKGETKFCATSLESMLDSARGAFGLKTKFRVLATKNLSRHTAPVQNYTILNVPKEIKTPKMVACHAMPYPYAVFYCHEHESDHKVFEVALRGSDGERVEAVGVCHMDTSQWNPDHTAFRVLRTRPGRSSVCHFFPADNLVWVA